jgi:plastocyanin
MSIRTSAQTRSRLVGFGLVVALASTLLSACSSGAGSARTIQVGASSDEFAGSFRAFFPRDVTVRPGMTLKFHQTWTGEPHTITTGTAVDELVKPEILPVVLRSKVLDPDGPDSNFTDAQNAAGEKFFNTMPFFFGEKGINQTAGQPCFVATGLPRDGKACPNQKQPDFTGTQSYFNSGFIPYLGSRGNEFDMKIADNATPGTYFYYCSLHGLGMSGQITVTKTGSIPSQATVNRQAQSEITAIAKPLAAQLKAEQAGRSEFKGNLAGSGSDTTAGIKGQVNEFTPRTVKAQVGKPVTWTFIHSHTISFNVPPYVPFYSVKKNGTVVESEAIFLPAGGFPGRTPPTQNEGPDGTAVLPAVHIDAGKFDGSGKLRSSGTDWQTGDTYSVTFTKAGTYPMACLVHPGMIGKVVVS